MTKTRSGNPHMGSRLDDFLKEEDVFQDIETQALKEVATWQKETRDNPKKRKKADHEIRVSTKRYDAFVAALNAPAIPRTRLKRLLTTPSVLERKRPDR
jgi:hypothetical protein